MKLGRITEYSFIIKLICLLKAQIVTGVDCGFGWRFLGDTQACYKVDTYGAEIYVLQSEADQRCHSYGAELSSIASQAEKDFLSGVVSHHVSSCEDVPVVYISKFIDSKKEESRNNYFYLGLMFHNETDLWKDPYGNNYTDQSLHLSSKRTAHSTCIIVNANDSEHSYLVLDGSSCNDADAWVCKKAIIMEISTTPKPAKPSFDFTSREVGFIMLSVFIMLDIVCILLIFLIFWLKSTLRSHLKVLESIGRKPTMDMYMAGNKTLEQTEEGLKSKSVNLTANSKSEPVIETPQLKKKNEGKVEMTISKSVKKKKEKSAETSGSHKKSTAKLPTLVNSIEHSKKLKQKPVTNVAHAVPAPPKIEKHKKTQTESTYEEMGPIESTKLEKKKPDTGKK